MKGTVLEDDFHIPLAWRRLRRLLFLLDAERVHEASMQALAAWSRILPPREPNYVTYKTLMGIDFPNPIGLAAGMDKNAVAIPAFSRLSFGHVEVGTITAKPQPGNPRPRLFRYPKKKAIVNRMGFNNQGALTVARRIEKLRRGRKVPIPLGINIGKSKVTPLEEAPQDYLESFQLLVDLADYIAINVSSPNTPGLRKLQSEESLRDILETLQNENQKRDQPRPLVVKFAPDLEKQDLFKSLEVAKELEVSGCILTNTTIDHSALTDSEKKEEGGLSGRPLFERSTEILKDVRREVPENFVLIGVGGVMDGKTAKAKLEAGADLIQTYTGFIYGGPTFARNISASLQRSSSVEKVSA